MKKSGLKEKMKNYINNTHKFDVKTWIAILLVIFVIASVFGFAFETVFYYFNSGMKEWFRRGTAFGPWINIYGIGAVLVFFLTYKFRKKPWLVSVLSGVTLSILELGTGMVIYYCMNGKRAWDYNIEICTLGSIGGFLCGRNIILFFLSGPILIYILVPFVFWVAKKMNRTLFLILAYVIGGVCVIDMIYNDIIAFFVPQFKSAGDIYGDMGYKFVEFPRGDKAFWKLK